MAWKGGGTEIGGRKWIAKKSRALSATAHDVRLIPNVLHRHLSGVPRLVTCMITHPPPVPEPRTFLGGASRFRRERERRRPMKEYMM